MRAGCYNERSGGKFGRLGRTSDMKKTMPYLLAFAVLVFYGLHQDFWFWRQAGPLILGFIPIGLFYHVLYSIAAAGLMWLLVRYCWPGHLEEAGGGTEPSPSTRSEKPTPS